MRYAGESKKTNEDTTNTRLRKSFHKALQQSKPAKSAHICITATCRKTSPSQDFISLLSALTPSETFEKNDVHRLLNLS
jgi:hypothetical protein